MRNSSLIIPTAAAVTSFRFGGFSKKMLGAFALDFGLRMAAFVKTRFGRALASAMLLGTVGSAYAADMAVKAPPPPPPAPVYSWNGCYLGV